MRGVDTNQKRLHGLVFPLQHPEGPRREPVIALFRREREDAVLQQCLQHRSVVTLVDPCDGDSELHVFHSVEAHVDGVLQAVC